MNALRTTPSAKLLSPWERLGEGSWLRAKIAINSSRRSISAKREANLRGLGYGG